MESQSTEFPYQGIQEDSDRDGMWMNLEDTGISELKQ